jgi:arsenite methyltransferase
MTFERIIPWVDPFTNKPLKEENNYLVGENSKYPLINQIPNFAESVTNKEQKQVQESFGEKWTKSDIAQSDESYEIKMKQIALDVMGITEEDLKIFENKTVLEVGCGSGGTVRMWAAKAKEFHGVDISKAVYKAPNVLKSYEINGVFAQADLNNLPYENNSFDIIVSAGVLHHTPDTKISLKNIITKIKPKGKCLFYIYKMKAPLREYADDFIRSKVSDLPYDVVWEKMKEITTFAKSLHDQNITIKIPEDVEVLEIKKGEYDLQRFIYQYFFKCYWNDIRDFEDSNLVNIDWYHPKFSWRHTEIEIKNWCKEFNLRIEYIKESESGYSCLVEKL